MRDGEQIAVLSHRIHDVKPGDIVVCKSGGGAGVGRPEERAPEAVKIDVKNGLISLQSALDIYKVVLEPDTLEIDSAATQNLRA